MTKPLFSVLMSVPDSMAEAIRDIIAERERQDNKWGQQNHDWGIWMLVLMEEVGEVCQAILSARACNDPLEYPVFLGNLREELVQVTAVGMQMIEYFDRVEADKIK